MNISKLINKNLVDLSIEAESQLQAIEILSKLLYKEEKITSKEEFKQAIIEREEEGTTGFGRGVAIPHCKSNSVKEVSIAVGRLQQGVEWDSIDGKLVELIIMLAVPKQEAAREHIEVLSEISSKLMEEEFLQELFQIQSPEKLINLLK